jgi:Tfp pilus assembly protein PilN
MNVAAPPGMAVALELLQVRQKRLDWAPMLRAVGDTIDARLILTGIRARSAGEQGNARLELTGLMRGDPPDMQAVPRFMEALRGGAIIRASLPQVQLGAMEEGVEGRFKIVCQTPQRSESEGTGS